MGTHISVMLQATKWSHYITRIINGEGEVLSSSSLTITTIDKTDSEVIEEENTGTEPTQPENTEEQPEVTVNEESITKEETVFP